MYTVQLVTEMFIKDPVRAIMLRVKQWEKIKAIPQAFDPETF